MNLSDAKLIKKSKVICIKAINLKWQLFIGRRRVGKTSLIKAIYIK